MARNSQLFLALDKSIADKSSALLVPILADTIFLHHLYKKYHWHVAGPTFYQYHLLFDKHAAEQLPIIDALAERLRTLGSIAPGMPDDVMRNKTIDEPPSPGSRPERMVVNLCDVHATIMSTVREAIKTTEAAGDAGTADLLTSEVLRAHELQLWFIRSSLDPAAT